MFLYFVLQTQKLFSQTRTKNRYITNKTVLPDTSKKKGTNYFTV